MQALLQAGNATKAAHVGNHIIHCSARSETKERNLERTHNGIFASPCVSLTRSYLRNWRRIHTGSRKRMLTTAYTRESEGGAGGYGKVRNDEVYNVFFYFHFSHTPRSHGRIQRGQALLPLNGTWSSEKPKALGPTATPGGQRMQAKWRRRRGIPGFVCDRKRHSRAIQKGAMQRLHGCNYQLAQKPRRGTRISGRARCRKSSR